MKTKLLILTFHTKSQYKMLVGKTIISISYEKFKSLIFAKRLNDKWESILRYFADKTTWNRKPDLFMNQPPAPPYRKINRKTRQNWFKQVMHEFRASDVLHFSIHIFSNSVIVFWTLQAIEKWLRRSNCVMPEWFLFGLTIARIAYIWERIVLKKQTTARNLGGKFIIVTICNESIPLEWEYREYITHTHKPMKCLQKTKHTYTLSKRNTM